MAELPPGGVPCHRCGYRFEVTENPIDRDATPSDGDLSMCLACGELAIFVAGAFGLTLCETTAEERDRALRDDTVVATLLARQQTADAALAAGKTWTGRS